MRELVVPTTVFRLTSRLVVLLVAIAVALHGDEIRAQSNSSNSTTLTVNSMSAAIDALASRYGYVITLEEPRYSYDGDFEDMPTQYRRDLDRYPQGAVPKVLVPRGSSLTLPVPASSVVSTRDMAEVLRQLVQLQSASDHGAHYRLEQVGDVFNVVPTETRDHNGNWSAQTSIFDAAISIPKQERAIMDAVNAVCAAVGAAGHVSVKLLVAPMSMLHYTRSVVGASNEPARNVMTRALSGLNRKLTWRVGYFAQMNSYLLVISVVPDKSSATVNIPVAPATSGVPAMAPARASSPSGSPMGSAAPQQSVGVQPPRWSGPK
jgi:hypothetical protein